MARVVLLGTGMPRPDPSRRGPAQVIDVDGQLLLIDCGAGALHRFVEAGLDPKRISRIAFTHLHSDHVTGIADLLWGGRLGGWWETPPAIVGPPGTRDFVARLIDAFHYDLKVRSFARRDVEPPVTEIGDGWIEEVAAFRLKAFRVEHAPVDQAFGFRVDFDRGSVVVSGDTRRSENLIANASGASVLVHEVISRPGMEGVIEAATDERVKDRARQILGYHTPADELGDIATRAGAEHLVLSHIVRAARPVEELLADARRGYDGRVTLGEDLMVFEIGGSP